MIHSLVNHFGEVQRIVAGDDHTSVLTREGEVKLVRGVPYELSMDSAGSIKTASIAAPEEQP